MVIQRSMVRRFIDGEDRVQEMPLPNSLEDFLLLTITERRVLRLLRLRPAWGVPLLLLVVLPWFIAIAVTSNGEFFATAIGHNLLGKVATGQQSRGALPGYYLVVFALTFWPGSLFAAVTAPFVWRRD